MVNTTKKIISVLLAAAMLASMSVSASAASVPGGRFTGRLNEDLYISPSDVTSNNNFYKELRDETMESSSSDLSITIREHANFDDVRTVGGDGYKTTGNAYYDEGNGRGVSFVPLTGSDSVYGLLPNIFNIEDQYSIGAAVPTNTASSQYKSLRVKQDNGTVLVPEITGSSITDFFSKLGNYFHTLSNRHSDNNFYNTYISPKGIITLMGDEKGSTLQKQYNGYRPEFESDDIRSIPILEGGKLTSEGLDMVNGAKTFVVDNEDNPYGDVFLAAHDDSGNVDDSKIAEDCYILIRRLLDVDDNTNVLGNLNSTPREEITAINEDNGNISATMDAFLNDLIKEAKDYEAARKGQVKIDVDKAKSVISDAITKEPISTGGTGIARNRNKEQGPDAPQYGVHWWDHVQDVYDAYGNYLYTVWRFNSSKFAQARRNWWNKEIVNEMPNWNNDELATPYWSELRPNTSTATKKATSIGVLADLRLDVTNPYGKFQASSRENYDLENKDAHERYQAICDILGDGDYDYEFESAREGFHDGFDEEAPDYKDYATDETESLFWFNSVLTGVLDLPKIGRRIPSFKEFVEFKGFNYEEVNAFRQWLINNGLYYNPDNTTPPYNGWTISSEEWEDGKLLELWKAVYYANSADNIRDCLGSLDISKSNLDEAKFNAIADSIASNASETEYNKINPTYYPYLNGYTNASFIPNPPATTSKQKIGKRYVTTTSLNIPEYSIYDNAMSFFHQLGMDSDKNNIPADKHMNLGFYKDVQVTGYSNNYVKTDGILGRYEWYVYYDDGGNRSSAEVVYHDTTTSLECPFTAVQDGTYWVDCYQSGYSTYEERMRYTTTYFLTEEVTKTILMSSLTPDIQIRLDEKTIAEKIKLKTDDEGYVVDDAAMQWRAYGDRVVENFTTQRVSDTGDVNLG